MIREEWCYIKNGKDEIIIGHKEKRNNFRGLIGVDEDGILRDSRERNDVEYGVMDL